MPGKRVDFQVTSSDGIRGYWLAVDKKDVPLVNGKGGITVDTGTEHILIWWMVGNAGETLKIVGKQQERNVVTVDRSAIPKNSERGAGIKRFKV